jgi:hypothetical protein
MNDCLGSTVFFYNCYKVTSFFSNCFPPLIIINEDYTNLFAFFFNVKIFILMVGYKQI